MNKVLKFILTITMLIVLVLLLSNETMAFDWSSSLNTFSTLSDSSSASSSAQSIVGSILVIVRVVAVGVAVIMLIVLAMKYMLASAGDRAEIKKHAVVYVVGAVVLFAASGILGIIADFAENISAGGVTTE